MSNTIELVRNDLENMHDIQTKKETNKRKREKKHKKDNDLFDDKDIACFSISSLIRFLDIDNRNTNTLGVSCCLIEMLILASSIALV
jgi:NADH:ubiquinone oxidoreductase subunit B-like Fe-S oxidoreductase